MPEEDKINIAILNTKLENINESIKEGFSENKEDHESIRREFSNFKEEIKREYATKKEVEPLQSVYGGIQSKLVNIIIGLLVILGSGTVAGGLIIQYLKN